MVVGTGGRRVGVGPEETTSNPRLLSVACGPSGARLKMATWQPTAARGDGIFRAANLFFFFSRINQEKKKQGKGREERRMEERGEGPQRVSGL